MKRLAYITLGLFLAVVAVPSRQSRDRRNRLRGGLSLVSRRTLRGRRGCLRGSSVRALRRRLSGLEAKLAF